MKPTSAEMEVRIAKIVDLIILGCQRQDIIRYASDKFGISIRQVETYLARARDIIRENANVDREQEIAEAVARYKRLIRDHWQNGRHQEIRKCQAEMNKLLGLNEANKIEINDVTAAPQETFIIGGKPIIFGNAKTDE